MMSPSHNGLFHSPSISLLGVKVHSLSMDEALDCLEKMIDSGSAHQVVTVNPEFIMKAQEHSEFRNVLNNASLAIPDGIGVVWASWLLGEKINSRLAGVDFVERIASVAVKRGYRIFLLGAEDGVAEKTAEVLTKRHPGLKIAGTFAGSPHPQDESEINEYIRAVQPHILLVAYGAPNQDLWIARNLVRLKVPVAIGVGGTFDFIAGKALRAPKWIQKSGFEWLHRLIQEPHRWHRMRALPRFAIRVFQYSISSRFST
jgi:N-acetylglucosaminyldiphosphoundecaprenol N-acetyl-beta-D-mannosaminyltransferase